ncbi:hypothetical protein WS71_31480 [Burkholderia mayonis]|uniref:Uncharacterized protein n=1 Tax=Burkholderia mayonis TaxID=1385591 RepID=A0A1B4G6N4_9BURK|nr:hypothetical protein WS71_31480 [Burkholderia mayonis]KVE46545.1 hypothetical protein WS71_22630 [Burkholderia mayonis]
MQRRYRGYRRGERGARIFQASGGAVNGRAAATARQPVARQPARAANASAWLVDERRDAQGLRTAPRNGGGAMRARTT